MKEYTEHLGKIETKINVIDQSIHRLLKRLRYQEVKEHHLLARIGDLEEDNQFFRKQEALFHKQIESADKAIDEGTKLIELFRPAVRRDMQASGVDAEGIAEFDESSKVSAELRKESLALRADRVQVHAELLATRAPLVGHEHPRRCWLSRVGTRLYVAGIKWLRSRKGWRP